MPSLKRERPDDDDMDDDDVDHHHVNGVDADVREDHHDDHTVLVEDESSSLMHPHQSTDQLDHDAARESHEHDIQRAAIGGDAEWNAMLFQLIFFKAVHGDLRPKPKDDKHKPLHDWMVAQRKEFKVYQETPEKSYLTADQIKVLDHLQFPWNTRGDEHWIRNFEHLKRFCKEHGHSMVPRTYVDVPNLCHWVTDQRRQLKNLKSGKPSTMTKERQRLLDEIGFVWQVRNRTTWDTRFEELVEFKEEKGTTIVPQHYAANRALGKWVAKQREQHRALKKGEHSFLTPDRLEQLNSIGFVWSMKGRLPKDDESSVIDEAAVAAAKAACAAAVEAQDAEVARQQDLEDPAAEAVEEVVMEVMQPTPNDDVDDDDDYDDEEESKQITTDV